MEVPHSAGMTAYVAALDWAAAVQVALNLLPCLLPCSAAPQSCPLPGRLEAQHCKAIAEFGPWHRVLVAARS